MKQDVIVEGKQLRRRPGDGILDKHKKPSHSVYLGGRAGKIFLVNSDREGRKRGVRICSLSVGKEGAVGS